MRSPAAGSLTMLAPLSCATRRMIGSSLTDVRSPARRPGAQDLEQPMQQPDDQRLALLSVERLAEARLALGQPANGHEHVQAATGRPRHSRAHGTRQQPPAPARGDPPPRPARFARPGQCSPLPAIAAAIGRVGLVDHEAVEQPGVAPAVVARDAGAPGRLPAKRASRAAGPRSAAAADDRADRQHRRVPTISASSMPGTARIGPTLTNGLDGAMTIRSAAPTASTTPGRGRCRSRCPRSGPHAPSSAKWRRTK